MKLIYCTECSDVIALRPEMMRACFCGKSQGRYVDEIKAEVFGPCIPLGFANLSFARSLRLRPLGKGWGQRFEAFVMPTHIDNVRQERIIVPGMTEDVS